jgi:hypothetical protein
MGLAVTMGLTADEVEPKQGKYSVNLLGVEFAGRENRYSCTDCAGYSLYMRSEGRDGMNELSNATNS